MVFASRSMYEGVWVPGFALILCYLYINCQITKATFSSSNPISHSKTNIFKPNHIFLRCQNVHRSIFSSPSLHCLKRHSELYVTIPIQNKLILFPTSRHANNIRFVLLFTLFKKAQWNNLLFPYSINWSIFLHSDKIIRSFLLFSLFEKAQIVICYY